MDLQNASVVLGHARVLSSDEIFQAILAGTPLNSIDARFGYVIRPNTDYRQDLYVVLTDESDEFIYLNLEGEGGIVEKTWSLTCTPSELLLIDEPVYRHLQAHQKSWRAQAEMVVLPSTSA